MKVPNEEIMYALGAPFPEEICRQKKDKYGNVLKSLDGTPFDFTPARAYQNRLDEVVGCANWKPRYEETAQGVKGFLALRIDGEWIEKEDIGGYAGMGQRDKQSGEFYVDEENNGKSGYSDAFKRACVVWGVGRSLYHEGVPKFLRELYENTPHASRFLPGRSSNVHTSQAPQQTNGYAQAARPASNGNGQSNDGPKREYGKPQTGRQFFPWVKKLEETSGNTTLLKSVTAYAQGKGHPFKSTEWPDEFVADAVAFVERLTSGATDQTVETAEARPQAAVGAPSFYGVLETMLHDWDKVDPIDSSGRLVRRVELIDEAYRGLVAKGKLKAIEGVSEEEQYDAVEDVYPMNRVTIRTVLSTFMALQGVRI